MVIKNQRGGISITNIAIIAGLILLAYLSYTQYLDDKIKQTLAQPINSLETAALQPLNQGVSVDKAQTAEKKTTPKVTPAPEVKVATPIEEKNITPMTKPGYYQNDTYFYQINFPPDWPVRIRSADDVSLGTVPPQNGQGAITIEVTTGESNNEIKQAKAEAAKYPGLISLTEEPVTLAGVTGTKIILNNFMSKTKSIYILLIKNGWNYIIKYSEESAKFSGEAEQALATFKFTR